ncbi:hypothetical protein SSTU70S_01049 [Stutzerimonas stutzeri]
MRAALERVQCALQRVGHRLWKALGAVGEIVDQRGQVSLGLVAKDLEQLWIQPVRGRLMFASRVYARFRLLYRSDGRQVRERLALGQGMRAGGQLIDIAALALRMSGELFDQCRQQVNNINNHLLDRFGRLDAAIQHAIEQVLDGPGQLANDQRAHHAPAAFERMEGASHFTERSLVIGLGQPRGQLLADRLQNLCRLFDEDLGQFVVDRLLPDRRREQARRYILGRRIDRQHRGGHDLLQIRRRFRRIEVLVQGRQGDLRQPEIGDLDLAPTGGRGTLIQNLELQRRQFRRRVIKLRIEGQVFHRDDAVVRWQGRRWRFVLPERYVARPFLLRIF